WIGTGEQDNRDVLAFFHPAQPSHNQKAIPRNTAAMAHVRRKLHIEHDQVGALRASLLNRGSAIHGGSDSVTRAGERKGGRFEDDAIVIHYEDSLLGHNKSLR